MERHWPIEEIGPVEVQNFPPSGSEWLLPQEVTEFVPLDLVYPGNWNLYLKLSGLMW